MSRELSRNADPDGVYRAGGAHVRAYARAGRPKPAKLAANPRLRAVVQTYLTMRYSPEQIAGRLRRQHPEDPEMWVSTETIYQLYVQSRGALHRDLVRYLRTGRTLRVPNRQGSHRKNRVLPDMVNISQRPATVDDRAVPGAWEGDLIIGKANASAISTLVKRSTGFTMLVHLPQGYRPEQMAHSLSSEILTLPDVLRGSLTWDQGVEMQDWKTVSAATGIAIYFCDPHSPWQRDTNENTNGLLRSYFAKGTDLTVHTAEYLDAVAAELNDRLRQRLDFAKPIEKIETLLLR